jgi:hypothetical protein
MDVYGILLHYECMFVLHVLRSRSVLHLALFPSVRVCLIVLCYWLLSPELGRERKETETLYSSDILEANIGCTHI